MSTSTQLQLEQKLPLVLRTCGILDKDMLVANMITHVHLTNNSAYEHSWPCSIFVIFTHLYYRSYYKAWLG